MLPPGLQTPREVTLYHDSVYESLITLGESYPFLYPWSGIGAFVVFGFLLIDYRTARWKQWLRYPVFALLFAFQVWCIFTNRAKNPAAAFGVGLLSAWGTLWVFSFMVARDCQSDFVRIERRQPNSESGTLSFISNGYMSNGSIDSQHKHDSSPERKRRNDLYWQSYPSTLYQRLDWVADVFCSFRGVGWNWQIWGFPPLPKSIEAQLHGQVDSSIPEDVTVSGNGIRRFSDRSALFKQSAKQIIAGYMALDVIKTVMHNDLYFVGYMDAAPPAYLPAFVQDSNSLLKAYRLLVSASGMYVALFTIFSLGPAFFCGVLGPEWIGVRGEAWMNSPDMFGSFHCVLDQGLAGWWGGWWHQTFRFAFEAPAAMLLKSLDIDKRSQTGKIISLLLAFFLSGCLHACGSYTQLGETRPLMGPMRFFLLQIVGILLEAYSAQMLRQTGVLQNSPRWLKRIFTFFYVHTWLYFTGPLLADDFAKGGLWLFEPIAISPLNALGFGARDDTWWCWWNGVLFWRQGKHWWDTGIAL